MSGLHRLLIAATCALGLMPAMAQADLSVSCKASLAGKNVTMIVPVGPGGGYDTYGRALAGVIDTLAQTRSRVVNMPAAGGLVAMSTLVDSTSEELVMMVYNATGVLLEDLEAGAPKWSSRLNALGVFYTEPSTWVSRPDFSIQTATRLVAASRAANRLEFDTIGGAMGTTIKVITGYQGSKDIEAAVLRGEADIMAVSLTTSLKSTSGGDLALKLLLSDKPDARAPGIPYLAGEGGVVAELTRTLSPEERAKRMEMASTGIVLSSDVRAVYTHKNLRPDLRDCMAEVVLAAIRDPAFAKEAEAQGRPVAPLDPAAAKAVLAVHMQTLAKLAETK